MSNLNPITRREFLKRSSQAALLSAAGSHSFRAKAVEPNGKQVAGDWPMFRGNRCLTGRAILPGEMRVAPTIAWQHKIVAGQVWAMIDPDPGRNFRSTLVRKDELSPNYFQSPEGRKWNIGSPLVDL